MSNEASGTTLLLRARRRRSSLLRLHFKRVSSSLSSLRCLLKQCYSEKNIKMLQLVIPLWKRVRRAKKIQSFYFSSYNRTEEIRPIGKLLSRARENRIGREKLFPFALPSFSFPDDSPVIKKLGVLLYSNNVSIVPRGIFSALVAFIAPNDSVFRVVAVQRHVR